MLDTVSSKRKGVTLFPAIRAAAENGHVDILRMLFKNGADVNYSYPNHPLGYKRSVVFHSSSPEVLQVILEQRPDLHNVDSVGGHALFHRPFRYDATFVKMVLDHERTIKASFIDSSGRNALFFAQSADAVDVLVRYGADVNLATDDDETPLFYADGSEVIIALARHGANVNHVNMCGRNALFQAIPSAVSALVQVGVDVNSVDDEGMSPLFYATSIEKVNELVAHGGDVDITDNEGKTALFFANGAEVVHGLANHGIDVQARDIKWRTALFYASSTEVVDAMLMRGVDQMTLGKEGKTPVFFAPSSDMVAWLVEKGCDINHQDKEGRTALYHAVVQSDKKTISWLLDNNASLEVRARNNKTPLDVAQVGGLDIFDLLVRHIQTSELKDIIENNMAMCGICHGTTPNVRFDPCGHTCCSSCAGNLRQVSTPSHCHMCRTEIARADRFYL